MNDRETNLALLAIGAVTKRLVVALLETKAIPPRKLSEALSFAATDVSGIEPLKGFYNELQSLVEYVDGDDVRRSRS